MHHHSFAGSGDSADVLSMLGLGLFFGGGGACLKFGGFLPGGAAKLRQRFFRVKNAVRRSCGEVNKFVRR